MFLRPSGKYLYAPEIRQILEINIIPDETLGIFDGLKVWIFMWNQHFSLKIHIIEKIMQFRSNSNTS